MTFQRFRGTKQWISVNPLSPTLYISHIFQVRAEEATLDASVPEANLTFQHLSRASQLPFKEKVEWFNKQCDLLRVPWDVEHQHLKVSPSIRVTHLIVISASVIDPDGRVRSPAVTDHLRSLTTSLGIKFVAPRQVLLVECCNC